jgi:hypothetical protein
MADYIMDRIRALGLPNLTRFDMNNWHPSQWNAQGTVQNWFYNDDGVLSPRGNRTWHGHPAGSSSVNPGRELLDGSPVAPNVGDLMIERVMVRSGPAQRNSSRMGLVFDLYPQSGGAVDTSIGQVREHNADGVYTSGEWAGH